MGAVRAVIGRACLWGAVLGVVPGFAQGTITLQGDRFIDGNGQPFFPMVMNYYVDMAFPAGQPPVGGHYPSAAEMAANVHLEHPSFFGLTGSYTDQADITQGAPQILHALYEIKYSGFNAIRLVMTPIKRPGLGFMLELKDYGTAQNVHDADIFIDPPYDPAVNPAMAFHLNAVLEVCSLANVAGLKVMLITANSPSFPELINGNAGDPQIEDYADFLGELAKFIHDHHVYNLLGYDLYGEPGLAELGQLKDTPQGMHTRSQICAIVHSWTSAIRAYDDHLITVGNYPGEGPFNGGWDPLLMDIDFSTIHQYPEPARFEYDADPSTYIQKCTRRFGDLMYHVDRTLRKPYMIVETGFIAHDHDTPNDGFSYPISVQGNETDENYIVEQTFPFIRNSRACGYGWWLFQDTHFESNGPMDPPDPNVEHISGDYFGLLNHGDPAPLDVNNGISGYEAYRKQAAWTFADYAVNPPAANPTAFGPVSPTVDMSEPYYNPFGHPENSTSVAYNGRTYYGTLTGHVQDEQSGLPIVGAYVKGTCIVARIPNELDYDEVYHSTYTFTDEHGDFILRGYDTQPGPLDDEGTVDLPERDRCIMDLKISTYGAGWIQYGEWDGSTPIQQNQTYNLHTAFSSIDRILDGVTVGLTDDQNFEATASLTAKHFTVEGDGNVHGGTSAIKATYEVHLLPGFHAQTGSEVHVYTGPVLMDCGAVDADNLRMLVPVDEDGPTVPAKPQRVIGLVLHSDPQAEEFQVAPNPTDGMAHLTWQCADCPTASPARLTVTSPAGTVVLERLIVPGRTDLDLHALASGAYNLSIEFQNKVHTRRIVIQ